MDVYGGPEWQRFGLSWATGSKRESMWTPGFVEYINVS